MTYTFKLARRLAVSRNLRLLPVLLLFAACSGGDATSPESSPTDSPHQDWRPREIIPVAVSINPSNVTLETNQLIHFRAHGLTSAGDSVGAAVTWSTTGGTILPDGRFSAAAIGTYSVTGRNRARGEDQVDTAIVEVVRRQPKLVAIEVTPSHASLTPGVSQTFTAIGRIPGGIPVQIGVNWSAVGGTIDAGGTYVAGDTAGTYQVVATNTAGTIADTAIVTISAPPAPPPPAPAPPPGLASITLVPSTVTLATSATKQFVAYGWTTAGDSVAINVAFTATGGTVTAGGLYTAGSSTGTFRVIAASGALADTSTVTVTVPLGSGPGSGIPMGLSGLLTAGVNPAPYTMSLDGYNAGTIQGRLSDARAKNLRLLLNMTGGSHENYKTDGVFDMAKWQAKMDTYNTDAIRQAVAAAVSDGTIVGNSVMDEPQNTSPDASWGPAGTMTKARVDQMCRYVKSIFPTLPVGVVHDHRMLEPDKNYASCEFLVSQYRESKGPVLSFRDGGLAFAARSNIAILFSLNLLNGGSIVAGCPIPATGGPGTRDNQCRMRPDQVRDYGLVLGPAGCALNMWRYDESFFANVENKAAAKVVADALAKLPRKACTRS
jgi:hypothetical protein